jgi:hypothetical protein
MLLLELFPGLNEKTGHMALAASAGFDPKVWYHATTYDFDEFVPSRWRRASYFADTPEGAIRGAGAGGNEHPALGGPTTNANRTGLQIIPVLIKGKTWGRDPLPLEWFPEKILYGKYKKVCRGKSPIKINGVNKREEEYLNYIRQNLFPKIYDEDVPVEKYYNYTGDKEDDLPLRRTRLPIPEPYFSYKDVEGTDNYAVDAMKAIGFENWLVNDEAGTSIAVSNPANIRVKHAAFDPNKLHSPKMNESAETFDADKINVKEVHDSKWNFIRYTFTIPLSHNAEIEAYVIANGDTLEFKDILTKNAKDHPLFRDNGSSSAAYSQTDRLGTAETRRLIRYIFSYVRERHPEIKNISSTRVTGARPASGKRSMDFELPIIKESFSPAFKAWFGDSKVVDEHGQPKVVYHGTRAMIHPDFAFDPKRKGVSTFIGIPVEVLRHGFFFTEDKEFANSFAFANGTVLEVYLSIKNPLHMLPTGVAKEDIEKLVAQGVDRKWLEHYAGDPVSTYEAFDEADGEWFAECIHNAGFDGVCMHEQDPETKNTHTVWIAFRPNQIKAVNNKGNFNPDDKRIFEALPP